MFQTLRLPVFTSALGLAFAAAAGVPARADATELMVGRGEPSPMAATTRPVVVELFLSQACSACPPAAEYVRQLSARPDVLTLSWHVEYWDMMASDGRGIWRDPFAHAAFSARQRAYNERLIGRSKVFTPQVIVDGRRSVVGSRRAQLLQLVERTAAEELAGADASVRVDAGSAHVRAGAVPHDVLLVRFLPEAATPVSAGANRGHVFTEANVITQATYLARAVTGEMSFELPMAGASGQLGCAILMQAADSGPIDAVARCDAP